MDIFLGFPTVWSWWCSTQCCQNRKKRQGTQVSSPPCLQPHCLEITGATNSPINHSNPCEKFNSIKLFRHCFMVTASPAVLQKGNLSWLANLNSSEMQGWERKRKSGRGNKVCTIKGRARPLFWSRRWTATHNLVKCRPYPPNMQV